MADENAPGSSAAGAAGFKLCAKFVELLPITGASISVTTASGAQSTIGITNSTAAAIEQVQFELGEGPHWDVIRTGRAVFVSDTTTETSDRWPVFASAIAALKVGAVFALPLRMGAVTVGVVDLYRSTAGALHTSEVAAGLSLADAVSEQAVRQALASADDEHQESAMAPAMRREIHQATGMILIQLGVSATEAFTRLKAHAFAEGRSLAEVAHDVVHRSLALTNDSN